MLKRARWIWDNLVEFRANNKSLFQPASTLAWNLFFILENDTA